MTARSLALLLAVFIAFVAALSTVVHRAARLHTPADVVTIASVWNEGKLEARAILPRDPEPTGELVVLETIVGESAIVVEPELVFALSLVPGHDGVSATLGGETAYVTPDDLLALQAYDHGAGLPELGISIGVRTADLLALLAQRLRTSPGEAQKRANFRRIRVERTLRGTEPSPQSLVTADTLTRAIVREAAFSAARYLARGMSLDGRMRYAIDAPTNKDLPGYEWPRHAGATYFLAQAAAASREPELAIAATRAASLLRDKASLTCGEYRCIGDDSTIEIGSSALAILAFVEIVRTGLDASFEPLARDLARFLRAQQRPDGEFMHIYERPSRHPVDEQFLYFSGEAAFALARVHLVTHEQADLDAASRALAYLVGPAWSFFGSRYYFGEEHWTCQAMDELWQRAPNPAALDFCVRWHAYSRRMQYGLGETPFDADGAFGVGPIVTPRLTPVASRSEAGVATRHALALSHGSEEELRELDAQLRRSLALLVRSQFRPGPRHLLADPQAVAGAIPGSEVDWQLRIDYAQHAGSAMLRWLEVVP